MMSAPARLSEVMISKTAARSSTIPFSAAALIIAYCRFDHHDVGAFINIEADLAQRLIRIGRIHLIRTTISKLRRTFGGFAKWTVKNRRELGRVTHNSSFGETIRIERFANGANAAIHHVTRRNHVRAGLRVRERRLY